MALDLGHFAQDSDSGSVSRRGRLGWLDELHRVGRHDPETALFSRVERTKSAYAMTDRYGRVTLTSDADANGLPVRFELSDQHSRYLDHLTWRPEYLSVGSSGALTLHVVMELNDEPASAIDVATLVTAYHNVRRDAEVVFDAVVKAFVLYWTARTDLMQLFTLKVPQTFTKPCLVYDVVDFDYLINDAIVKPKELYKSKDHASLRALAGLTRMSSVYDSFDPASLQQLAGLDLGSRSDELWFVNEARLVRHHPDRLSNPFVEAFFQDVRTLTEILIQRSSSLIYLIQWLKSAQSSLLSDLMQAQDSITAMKVMKRLGVLLGEMSFVVSDPSRIAETSGHSFFRNLTARLTERMGIDGRREQLHSAFVDMLALSQALSSQSVIEATQSIEESSLEVARASRRWALYAAIFTAVAALAAIIQLVTSIWLAPADNTKAPVPNSSSSPVSSITPTSKSSHSK